MWKMGTLLTQVEFGAEEVEALQVVMVRMLIPLRYALYLQLCGREDTAGGE